ncbi:Protein 21.1 [Giardia lamblia P15]|uniref:Protein 21.1 n=1 Tax=Giardia intestinalis (strain P15) TaxID=658858 RepID=E1F018_GIAIA|nr:Protein 21.1 [Giardia lamblia P15]
MQIGGYTYLAVLHKTEHETAVLAQQQLDSDHIKLIRLVPFNEEILLNIKLLAELKQQDSIRTYQVISTFESNGLIRTTEEFLKEIPLCERILPYILREESMHIEDIRQLAQGIVDALTKCWEQLSKLIADNSKLSCILLSSLTLYNVTIAPSTSNGLPTVQCVLKGPGLCSIHAGDTIATPTFISIRFGRLLYCLLTTSVHDFLPIEVMTESLRLCSRGADPLWQDLANLAIDCLTRPNMQISEIWHRLHTNHDVVDLPVGGFISNSPSFMLSPPLSPQRSPSPLPLSLSELLLDRQQHYTPLMIAIISNQLHTARIVYKDFLHKRDAHRNTALILAVLCNNIPLVELLAEHEHGCTNSNGDTALLVAITNGLYECCLPLFQYELSIPNNISGILPRQMAFEARQHAILDAIIAFQSVPRDPEGCTALMRAAMDGDPVDDLVDKEFGCTHDASNGYTALMFAIVNGNNNACKKLARYEALIDDSTGKSPLELAILSHQATCALTLLQHSQNPMLDTSVNADLVAAITAEQWDIAEKLLRRLIGKRLVSRSLGRRQSQQKNTVCNVIEVDSEGNTELMRYFATEPVTNIESKKSYWQALIPTQAGHVNKAGEAALHIAIRRELVSAISLLIPYEMHIRDNYGRLPFRQAVNLRNAGAVTAILDTLHLFQDINQRLRIIKFLERGDWQALTRFFENFPDTSAFL